MNRKKYIKKSDLAMFTYMFFLLAFLIQISCLITQYYFFNDVIKIFYMLGYFIGIYKLLNQKWTKKSLLFSLSLIIIGLLLWYTNKDLNILISMTPINVFFLIICSKDVDFEKYIKVDIICRILFSVLLLVLLFLRYLTDVTTVRSNGLLRYSLGYTHPNRFGSSMFLIVLYLAYLRRDELGWKDVFFQIAMLVFIEVVANSRSSEIGVILVMLYTLYKVINFKIKQEVNIKLAIKSLAIPFVVVLVFLTFYIAWIFNPNNIIIAFFNKLFNYRLDLANQALNYYKITLFGNGIAPISWDYVLANNLPKALTATDIMYIYIYVIYGVVGLAVFLYVFIRNINYARKKDIFLCFAMLIIALVSCIENQYCSYGTNIFLLLFSKCIFKD